MKIIFLFAALLFGSCSLIFERLSVDSCSEHEGGACSDDILIICEEGLRLYIECDPGTCDPVGVCAECGDGVVSLLKGEACDDGNVVSGDGCTGDCSKIERCGDGLSDEGEICDDGNNEDGDGCRSDCLSNETCGNGLLDPANNEACDDGNGLSGDGCEFDCSLSCGNGFLDLAADEECDDGNGSLFDGCAQCKVEPGHLFDFFFEPNNSLPHTISNSPQGDNFSVAAATPVGEGIFIIHGEVGIEGDEDCYALTNLLSQPSVLSLQALSSPVDGGFTCDLEPVRLILRDASGVTLADNGNLCVPFETSIPANQTVFLQVVAPLDTLISPYSVFFGFCGDGQTNGPTEQCDDGNIIDGDGCSLCRNEVCGDGIVQSIAGEECDSGAGLFGSGCDPNCKLSRCGNGFLALNDGETCDDGNPNGGDGCGATCLREDLPLCQNSVIDPGEECDDGNSSVSDDCNNDCTLPSCGDGISRADLGEQCDDGNNFQFDLCNAVCVAASCGNGRVDLFLDETCDDGNLLNGDGCDSDCQPSCGNGVIDPGEQCEDGNLIQFDDCAHCQNAQCGDGVIQVGVELCDDGELFGPCVSNGCGS